MLFLLVASTARAQCVSAPACAAAPCPFSAAASWSSSVGCLAPPDQAGERWVIPPGHSVVVDAASQVTGIGTVEGDLSFDPSPGNRDEHGYRNLVIVTAQGDDLSCLPGGSIRLRAGDRLRFDTRSGVAGFGHYDGCLLDFRGSAFPTTIAAIAAVDDGPACGNAAPVGRAWTIAPAAGLGQAKVGRRVIVQSGPLRNRHFEIAAVTPDALVLCSHLADARSLGERLTPRAVVGLPPGPGTAGHHSTPAVTAGDESCTGPGTPHACCLAAGQGTCVDGPDPSPGDAILLVDDGTIDDVVGGNGWRLLDRGDQTANCDGFPCSGSDPFPIVQYMNLSGFGGGGNNQGVTAAVFSVRTADQPVPDFLGNNLHGFKSDYGIVFRGIKNTRIEWNAVHDSERPPGSSDNYCQLNVHQHKRSEAGLLDTPAADVLIRNNVAWGTKQCALQVNDADNGAEAHPLFQAHGIQVDDNLVFGGCAVGPGIACEAIHIHSCRDCQARGNVCYDLHNANNTTGTCIKVGGTASDDGTDVSFNWLVNGSGTGIRCDEDASAPANLTNCVHVGITGNYVSHFRNSGGLGGRWFGNVVKNFGLDNPGGCGLDNPIRAKGCYIGIDDAVAATPLCTATASHCGRANVAWSRSGGNTGRTDVAASDLVLGRMGSLPGGVERNGFDNERFATGFVADFNGTISHVTHDNRGGAARTFGFSDEQPAVPVTWTIGDLLAGYKNDDWLVKCTAAAGVQEVIGSAWSLLTGDPAEGGGAISPGCSTAATPSRPASLSWNDRLHLDYGLPPGAPERTAASDGSAIGARAFLFRSDRVAPQWAGMLPYDNGLPASFSNGTPNDDADDDAVMDFLDDCPGLFNPSQYDADGDGAGNGCDCAASDPGAWGIPGEAELFVAQAGDGVTALLTWNPPVTGGLATAMSYDVLRTTQPSDFVAAATCLGTGLAGTSATDPEAPPAGSGFFYLLRARNVCGAGPAHHDSSGAVIPARSCP